MITLKELKTRISKLQTRLVAQKKERVDICREVSMTEEKIADLQQEIEKLTDKAPVISEHAILRYLERKADIDMQDISGKILTPKVIEYITQFKSGKFPIGDGLRAVVRDSVIVTIE